MTGSARSAAAAAATGFAGGKRPAIGMGIAQRKRSLSIDTLTISTF